MYFEFESEESISAVIKTLLEKKINILLVDNQWDKIIQSISNKNLIDMESKSLKTINIDHHCPFSFRHLYSTLDFLVDRVTYFSLEDLVRYAIIRDDIPGSRAHEIKAQYKNSYVFNSYQKTHHKINFIGNNLLNPSISPDPYVTFKEFLTIIKEKNLLLFRILTFEKIKKSSFFLSEFFDFFDINNTLKFPFSKNVFFNNFMDFINFSKETGIDLTEFNAFNYSVSDEKLPYVVFIQEGIFCYQARIFGNHEINSHMYDIENCNINSFEPFKRKIRLPGDRANLFSSTFDYYMQDVLKLKRKSINSIKIQKTYQIISGDLDDCYLLHKSHYFFINKIKVNKWNELPDFFIGFSDYEINRIKSYARSKDIKKIFVANFKTFELEEYNIKKSRKRHSVIVTY